MSQTETSVADAVARATPRRSAMALAQGGNRMRSPDRDPDANGKGASADMAGNHVPGCARFAMRPVR